MLDEIHLADGKVLEELRLLFNFAAGWLFSEASPLPIFCPVQCRAFSFSGGEA
ncbi:hypothetical protein NZJ93_06100 [Desulfofundulus thermocisternus]|nr:hypothetical protein [Desulfofundulus thermocisternus]